MTEDNPNAVAPAKHRPTSEGREAPGASSKAPTTEQLRDAIDSGKTGDKVGFPDPATVPMGADSEAGGHPMTPEMRQMAYDEEVGRPDADDRSDTAGDERPTSAGRP